jgi:hypothetical protein
MGSSVSVSLPPLPPGATLNTPPAAAANGGGGLPPLPPGATLNAPHSATAQPAPQNDSVSPAMANPNGEGTYRMNGPQGPAAMPYSDVHSALSTGYQFADDQESQRFGKDFSYDPGRMPSGAAGVLKGGPLNPVQRGALKSAAQVPVTIAGWLDSIESGLGKMDEKISGQSNPQGSGTDYQGATKGALEKVAPGSTQPVQGAGEQVGALAETMMEWMSGEGAAKAAFEALPLSMRMKKVAETMGILEKNPALATAVKEGMKAKALSILGRNVVTGAGLGAQALAHGATPGEAAESGAVGAGTGIVLEGGLRSLQAAKAAYLAHVNDGPIKLADYQNAIKDYRQQVATRQTATDAANATYRDAMSQRELDHAQAFEDYRNALNDRQRSIENARTQWKTSLDKQAQDHAAAMEEYTRQVGETNSANDQATQDWKTQLDAQAQKHAQDVADYKAQAAAHEQTVTALQKSGAGALKGQRQIEAQQGIRNIAREATESSLNRFNDANKGTLAITGEPINPPADATGAAREVGTFGEGAEKIREAARPIYEQINEATGGQFNKLQSTRAAAMRAQDFAGVDKANDSIDDMLSRNPGVSSESLKAARSAWHDSKDLDRIHGAVEGAFNGISEEMAQQPGVSGRILKGGTGDSGALQTRLGAILRGPKAMKPERISELIGPDGLAGLYRASHLVSTPELRQATQDLAEEIARAMPAPEAPVKPNAPERPAMQPKPVRPERPATIPAPEIPARPVRPDKPAAPEKPEALPKPVKPERPEFRSQTNTLRDVMTTSAVGAAMGHLTGVPYAYAVPAANTARYVLRQMVTNPKIGELMEYAIDFGADKARAANVIAGALTRTANAHRPEER